MQRCRLGTLPSLHLSHGLCLRSLLCAELSGRLHLASQRLLRHISRRLLVSQLLRHSKLSLRRLHRLRRRPGVQLRRRTLLRRRLLGLGRLHAGHGLLLGPSHPLLLAPLLAHGGHLGLQALLGLHLGRCLVLGLRSVLGGGLGRQLLGRLGLSSVGVGGQGLMLHSGHLGRGWGNRCRSYRNNRRRLQHPHLAAGQLLTFFVDRLLGLLVVLHHSLDLHLCHRDQPCLLAAQGPAVEPGGRLIHRGPRSVDRC
mmetsp:Transcript_3014/g.6817  ORF Transcript_3014/g.6817 Transcript_3014/m.6817 type:complete len:254 (-) Transcript_3014:183-944(-)